MTTPVVRQGPHGSSSLLYGSFAGKAPPTKTYTSQFTQHSVSGTSGSLYGSFAGKVAGTAPTITSVTALSGTELSVAWTGTASRYRLDGGTPVALVDTVSPATISGLTPNTEYDVELDNGDGSWSNLVTEWTDNTGGGGGSLFELADGAHAHNVDNLALTLGYSLAVQDATHGHAADSLGLSTDSAASLTVNDATHAHAADTAALGSTSSLTVADATHGHAADGLDLDLAAALAIADAVHGHTADGLALTVDLWLAANDATHGHTADGLALSTSASDLSIADALHAHSAEAMTLSETGPRVNSAPPSGHGPRPGRRGVVLSTGRRSNMSTRTR